MSDAVQHLNRPQGRIAYEITGPSHGRLVVCVPGMGDLRRVYRVLAADLADAGYRVASMDLRGHGDSDATFTSYDDEATASDAAALVQHLTRTEGGQQATAVLIGNSLGAGAAVITAAEHPELIGDLVLVGPFVRDPEGRGLMKLALRVMLLRPWGRAAWKSFFTSLYPGRKPADFAEHLAAVDASLRRPAHWKAFVATTRTTHAPAQQRLSAVRARALVVMGEKDPDFTDPAVEAEYIREALGGSVLMVPESGHYPQAEYPEVVSPAVIDFLAAADA